jgi:hypothetical protein
MSRKKETERGLEEENESNHTITAGGDSCKQPVEASHDALAEQDESKLKNRKL